MSGDAELDRYADLVVMLAAPGVDRSALLAEHGFDEDGWEQYDDRWQARLSADEVAADAEGQIPPLWLAFSQALQRAQERRSKGLLNLERYAAIARLLARGGDITAALEREGISVLDFLHAHRHWIQRAAKDDELSAKLTKLLS